MATDRPETPAPARLRVVGGGEPTPEELAAVVVALTPVATGDGERPVRPAGWRRAAMVEGVGGRPAASPADLDVTLALG